MSVLATSPEQKHGGAPSAPPTFAERLARKQGGVVSRSQLYTAGVRRWELTAELRAGRWTRQGRQIVGMGPMTPTGTWWRAIFRVGADAALDGTTALAAYGLRNFYDAVHSSVSRGARFRRLPGVTVHETRRRVPGDLDGGRLPRVRPEVAAVRAALARSDRQAALVIVMSVQQRVVDPLLLRDAVQTVRRARRRTLIRIVSRDATTGTEALGELDFARMCRRAGLPEPTR